MKHRQLNSRIICLIGYHVFHTDCPLQAINPKRLNKSVHPIIPIETTHIQRIDKKEGENKEKKRGGKCVYIYIHQNWININYQKTENISCEWQNKSGGGIASQKKRSSSSISLLYKVMMCRGAQKVLNSPLLSVYSQGSCILVLNGPTRIPENMLDCIHCSSPMAEGCLDDKSTFFLFGIEYGQNLPFSGGDLIYRYPSLGGPLGLRHVQSGSVMVEVARHPFSGCSECAHWL